MTLSGQYVDTFAEATHALPGGMSMNADYPFMLPKIVKIEGDQITIVGKRGETATAKIRHGSREWFALEQSSSFEKLFHRKPTKFHFYPFKSTTT